MAHEEVVAERKTRDLIEQFVGDLMKRQVVLYNDHAFLRMADIHFGVKLEPAQRRPGKAVSLGQGAGDLARTARQHELEAHGFEQQRQAKLAQSGHRHPHRAERSDVPAGVGDQLINLVLGKPYAPG